MFFELHPGIRCIFRLEKSEKSLHGVPKFENQADQAGFHPAVEHHRNACVLILA
jgi:hypothetical protein